MFSFINMYLHITRSFFFNQNWEIIEGSNRPGFTTTLDNTEWLTKASSSSQIIHLSYEFLIISNTCQSSDNPHYSRQNVEILRKQKQEDSFVKFNIYRKFLSRISGIKSVIYCSSLKSSFSVSFTDLVI